MLRSGLMYEGEFNKFVRDFLRFYGEILGRLSSHAREVVCRQVTVSDEYLVDTYVEAVEVWTRRLPDRPDARVAVIKFIKAIVDSTFRCYSERREEHEQPVVVTIEKEMNEPVCAARDEEIEIPETHRAEVLPAREVKFTEQISNIQERIREQRWILCQVDLQAREAERSNPKPRQASRYERERIPRGIRRRIVKRMIDLSELYQRVQRMRMFHLEFEQPRWAVEEWVASMVNSIDNQQRKIARLREMI